MDIWTSKEFLSALAGGTLSLLGTVVTLIFQQRSARTERERVVKRFLANLIDHLRTISEQLNQHFEAKGEIWFEYTDQVKISFDTFNRNIEAMSFLSNDDLLAKVRNHISQVFYKSQQAVFWQRQIYDVIQKNKDQKATATTETNSLLESEFANAKANAKDCILELKRMALDTSELKRALK